MGWAAWREQCSGGARRPFRGCQREARCSDPRRRASLLPNHSHCTCRTTQRPCPPPPPPANVPNAGHVGPAGGAARGHRPLPVGAAAGPHVGGARVPGHGGHARAGRWCVKLRKDSPLKEMGFSSWRECFTTLTPTPPWGQGCWVRRSTPNRLSPAPTNLNGCCWQARARTGAGQAGPSLRPPRARAQAWTSEDLFYACANRLPIHR